MGRGWGVAGHVVGRSSFLLVPALIRVFVLL